MASRTTPTGARRPAAPKASPKAAPKAAPKTAPKTAPKAEPKASFHFSIKQAEKEREEELAENPIEPFTVESLTGEPIVFRNPHAMGWQEAAMVTLREPHTSIRIMLEDESLDLFYSQGDFSQETLQGLIMSWMDYYGIEPGN